MVTTWLDRITDETNVWFSAVKADEADDPEAAAVLYLEDAEALMGSGSTVRAALSASCAADCLAKLGDQEGSRRLYFEAGVMYGENADAKVSSSIREALWSLQRSYECFVLAEDVKEADNAREAFEVLAKRVNPFSLGAEGLELPKVRPMGRTAAHTNKPDPGGKVRSAFESFLRQRLKARGEEGPKFPAESSRGEEEFLGQEGLAGQLG